MEGKRVHRVCWVYGNNEDKANGHFSSGRTSGGGRIGQDKGQNHYSILPVHTEGWKLSSRYWFWGINSSDKKKTKSKTFNESCSAFPWEMSQPSPDTSAQLGWIFSDWSLKATGSKYKISSIFLSSAIALHFAKALTMLKTLEGSTCIYHGLCGQVLNGKLIVWAAVILQTQNWKI